MIGTTYIMKGSAQTYNIAMSLERLNTYLMHIEPNSYFTIIYDQSHDNKIRFVIECDHNRTFTTIEAPTIAADDQILPVQPRTHCNKIIMSSTIFQTYIKRLTRGYDPQHDKKSIHIIHDRDVEGNERFQFIQEATDKISINMNSQTVNLNTVKLEINDEDEEYVDEDEQTRKQIVNVAESIANAYFNNNSTTSKSYFKCEEKYYDTIHAICDLGPLSTICKVTTLSKQVEICLYGKDDDYDSPMIVITYEVENLGFLKFIIRCKESERNDEFHPRKRLKL